MSAGTVSFHITYGNVCGGAEKYPRAGADGVTARRVFYGRRNGVSRDFYGRRRDGAARFFMDGVTARRGVFYERRRHKVATG